MSTSEAFQIPLSVAESYEATFVPRLFREWAPHVLDAARVGPGTSLLDVACGTGIVARTAVERIGNDGSVIGVDLNEAMLTVAQRVAPDLDWREGDVADLPFDDDTFDAVTCQMAMMFFPDRDRALAEMIRVTRPGGWIALAVPASLDAQPAYRPFVDIAARHSGPEARALLGSYWNCGDADELVAGLEQAGLGPIDRRTRTGTATFDSSDAMVATEVESTPLIDRIDEQTYARIRTEVGEALARYTKPDGLFEIPFVGHVVGAQVPAEKSRSARRVTTTAPPT
ncbi:MAG: methyltransferase domain-containing protein [Acidimicrobiia bacterium]|nr:methyltransferase domain-containing protein [Acidimicrobiia bacterium]